jgi:hypothetical protein
MRNGNGRPPLEQDDVVRLPVELMAEPDVTLGIIRVYAAIRRRVGFEPADEENFLIAWPSITWIAERARVHRATVIEAVRFLADRDYILVERRPNRSSVYNLIVRRTWFRENGRGDAAIRAYRSWMRDMADESRRSQAREAGERNSRQTLDSARKSPPDDRPERKSPVGDRPDAQTSPGDDLGSRQETTDPVAGRRPISVDHGSVDQGSVVRVAPLALVPSREPDRELARRMLAEIKRRHGSPA